VLLCGSGVYGTYIRNPIPVHREFDRRSANDDDVLNYSTGSVEMDLKRSYEFVEDK
jgi:hypothetical protein